MEEVQESNLLRETTAVVSPAVSIIIPAYNAAAYLKQTLDSILSQSFSNYEIIVINDGSPDTEQLEEILDPYKEHLTYIIQENFGAAAARNTGLRAARAEVVAFLDADDYWLPDYLAEQISFLDESGADLVYCDALLIGDSPLAGRTYMQAAPSHGPVTPESLLSLECNVITSGVVARKQPILEIGSFDEGIKRGHDFDLWLRLAKNRAKLSYQHKALFHHRMLESGLSGDAKSQIVRALNVLAMIWNRGGLTPAEQDAFERTQHNLKAHLALEEGKEKLLKRDFAGAVESFKESQKLRRSWKVLLVCFGLRVSPGLLWRFYRGRDLTAS